MNKTSRYFNWSDGFHRLRRLNRSFKTLEEAERFAEGKCNAEIYKTSGKFKVEWTKKIPEA